MNLMATDESRSSWGLWPADSSARISKGSDEFDPHLRLFTVTPAVDSRNVLGSLASHDQQGYPRNTVYLMATVETRLSWGLWPAASSARISKGSDEFDPPP